MSAMLNVGIDLGGKTISANIPSGVTFAERKTVIQTINGNYIEEYVTAGTSYVDVYYNDVSIGYLYTYNGTSGASYNNITLPNDFGVVSEIDHYSVSYPYLSRTENGNVYAFTEDSNKVELMGTAVFPDVLFTGNIPSGTFQNKYTLSKSAANYSHMRIYFATNNRLYNSVDLYQPNGKTAYLMSGNTNHDPKFYIKYCEVTINGTSINVTANSSGTVRINPTPTHDAETKVCITRVEAWN